MAVGESAGTVFVTIQGDASQLQQIFAQTQSAAQQAGANIASSFTTGTRAAAAGTANLSTEIDRLIQVIQQESAAASLATQRNLALGRSVQQIGQHAQQGGFSVRYMFLGLKDIAEGRTTFALAEISNQLVRMGPAALALGGAVAASAGAIYGLQKLTDYWSGLPEAEKRATEEAKAYDQEIGKIRDKLFEIQAKGNITGFGAVSGEALTAATGQTQRKLEADQALIAGLRRDLAKQEGIAAGGPTLGSQGVVVQNKAAAAAAINVQTLTKQLDAALKQQEVDQAAHDELVTKSLTAQITQNSAFTDAKIATDERAAKASIDLLRTRAEISLKIEEENGKARIAAIESPYGRAKAEADLEVKLAQDRQAALSAINAKETADRRKSLKDQIAAIPSTETDKAAGEKRLKLQGEIANLPAEQANKDLALEGGVTEAQNKARNNVALAQVQREGVARLNEEIAKTGEALDRAWKEGQRAASEYTTKSLEAIARANEIAEKSAGEQAALKIAAQKIALEGQYGSAVAHSLSQELAYRQQINVLDAQEREAKIAGLQAELQTEEAVSNEMRDLARIASLKAEIAKLGQEDANATQSAANTVAREKLDRSAGGQLGQSINKAPGQVGAALAGAVIDGKNIGKDIRDSLKGIGKEMLGEVFTGVITALLGNTVATIANTASVELNTLIAGIGHLFGFAGGTDFAPGGLSVVGERGPELVNLPRGAQVIPNHVLAAVASGGALGANSYTSSVSSTSLSRSFTINGGLHVHGAQNAEQVMRELPRALKRRGSGFSPFAN